MVEILDTFIEKASNCLPYLSQLLKNIIHIQMSIFPSFKLREVLISKRQKLVDLTISTVKRQVNSDLSILRFTVSSSTSKEIRRIAQLASENSRLSLLQARMTQIRPGTRSEEGQLFSQATA